MGHYHTEIVIPADVDVDSVVKEIMEPFNECPEDLTDGESNHYAFWDFWTIGGRWAGAKLQATLAPEDIERFFDALRDKKVTVSGLQAGKKEISPSEQIPMVDALWHEMVPAAPEGPCPYFHHSNDQYSSTSLITHDIMPFATVPQSLTMDRLIFGARNRGNTRWKAEYMLQDMFYNGANMLKTRWDGTFAQGVDMFAKYSEFYSDSYRNRSAPKPDAQVVTVDYHS